MTVLPERRAADVQLAGLLVKVDHLEKAFEKMDAKIDFMSERMAKADGAMRMLMFLIGISGMIGAVAGAIATRYFPKGL